MVDVEHAEEIGAVEKRRGAQRVEAFLDDRGSNAFAAWVVAVADGEQRPTGRDRGARQRPRRDLADAREVGRGQAATDLRDRMPIGPQQEDSAAVAFEQDHRVIDQPGQDPVQVESRTDIAGHPAERLRPMQEVRDFVSAACAGDERTHGVGDDPGDIDVA